MQISGLLSHFPDGTGDGEKEAGERVDALRAVGPATNARSADIFQRFHMTLFSPMKTRRDAFLQKIAEKVSIFKGFKGRSLPA